jgi:RNA polymerase sigma-70 factor (ECF subfamily)
LEQEEGLMGDAHFVKQLQAGDPSAYQHLVETYGPPLQRYLSRILGDPALGEDLVAETYVRVVEHISTYTERGVPLAAWIYRIARNLAFLTRKRTRQTVALECAALMPDPAPEPSVLVGARLERQHLWALVQRLPLRQRQVLVLRFAQSLDTPAIADFLNLSPNAVRQLQHRALQNLARHLTLGDDATEPNQLA